MNNPRYDVIVIGAGTMGSAACFHLASRGWRVLALEQFSSVPHEQGAHGGQSRIIRKAYFEHPAYVPLLEKAYQNWRDLEQLTGEQVYYPTGLVYGGTAAHPVMQGVKASASAFGINISVIPHREIAGAYPFFSLPDNMELLHEPGAGFLVPEKCIALYLREAQRRGAVILTGTKVLTWRKEKSGVTVLTEKGSFSAGKIVVTSGAWTRKLAERASLPLIITRQVLLWVKPTDPALFVPGKFPCWMLALPGTSGVYYGFPYLSGEIFPGPSGLKLAWHHPGREADPDQMNREVSKSELRSLVDGVKDYFPAANQEITGTKTCMYSNTPDEHFIIDHLPGSEGAVTIACGFSGHGFKFASVVGEILADLATNGKTELPIGFLRLNRFK